MSDPTPAPAADRSPAPPLPPPPPFGPGDRIELVIADVAFGGEGVARADGFVVFVPFALPGERVRVELTEVKRTFARGRVIEILDRSPDRVEPRCQHFGVCGGCQYQHASYALQVRLKHKQVADLLQRIGGFDPALVAPVVPCPEPYGYRNRIMIRSQWCKPEQRLVIGFLGYDNKFVVDLDACPIAEPALNEEIRRVRANPPPKGGIKVVLRIPPDGWDVPRDSFFQNNFFLLPGLVGVVRQRLKASGVSHLIDAYCGVGFFAIELAAGVQAATGIEIDEQAVRSARRNATARGASNTTFVSGDVPLLLASVLGKAGPEKTAVILDPPRVGCTPGTLALLRDARPAQILYVSCHPATLARDLNALCRDGVYELVSLTPLDMFPQTQHVECVADLRARDGTAAGNRP